jgi:hypothetical protein
MTASLHAFLDALLPAAPTKLGPVTLLPLRAPARGPAVALLAPDTAEVQEKGQGGIVGEVDVQNLAGLPLLLLAGELLVGAKQNRIVNASTLVGTRTTQTLHVSCVEQGRWAFGRGSSGFRAGGTTAPWSMRSRSSRSSSRSKRHRGVSRADQGAVWQDVRTHLRTHAVQSDTMDLTDAVERDRVRVSTVLAGWTPGPEDVGAALFVGDRLVGVEAFGRPETWAAAAPRVLAGVVQEVPETDAPPPDPGAAWAALRERVRTAELAETRGDGLGEELHGEAGQAHLVALLHEDAVVHLRIAEGLADSPEPPGRGRGTRTGVHGTLLAPEARLRDRAQREQARAERQRASEARMAERSACVDAARTLRRQLRAHDDDTLRIDRPTLVARARFHRHWSQRGRAAHALPLPRRIAGGLAAWPMHDLDAARDFLALVERIGCPRGAFVLVDPQDPPAARDRRWLALHPAAPGVLEGRAVG